MHSDLPNSPGRGATWEHKVPRDVATEIVGAIECVVADQLRPMIEQLEAAARVTGEELRGRFERGSGR